METRGLEVYGFGFVPLEETHIRMHMRFKETLCEASLTAKIGLWPASEFDDPVIVLSHIDPLTLIQAEDEFGRLPAIGDVNGILKFPIKIISVPWEKKDQVLATLRGQAPVLERAA